MKRECGETSSRTRLIGNIARLFFDEQRRSVTSRIFAGMHRNFHFRFHGYQQLFQTAAVTKLLRYDGGQIGRWNPFTINYRMFRLLKRRVCFLINARNVAFCEMHFTLVYRFAIGIDQLEHINYGYYTV